MKTKNYSKILLILLFSSLICSTVFVEDTNSMKVNVLEKKIKKRSQTEIPYSDKKLGSFVKDGRTYFRLFSPSAAKVKLVIFKRPEEAYGNEIEMERDENGIWELSLEGERYGLYYGFRIRNLRMPGIESIICLDPYAKAVTTYNTYLNPRRAIVVKEDDYDWEGDTWIQTDWRDLIIYEMHVRDMTEHPSSGAKKRGTYQGLIEKERTGGIDYIKNLGVNAVELLPAQEFANIEIPFGDSINGKFNTWNPYERNHWGYMTAAYFAPEAYYSEDVRKIEFYKWTGKKAKAVTDFKDMVKAFHREGIAVIMDVVYNHISEYELGNLKEIDKEYYFRLDKKGNYITQSYCGNDIKTENPMVRRLIIDSIVYWMKEYHVDGFRFDLGKLIDWQTIEEIIREAQKINPYVVSVCEPWGGGYDPAGFSVRGWGSWNDQIRNGIKGENPFDGQGWIFGKWYGNNDPYRIRSYVNGTLAKDLHGLFLLPEHSVNYLESHDGYTLGDFIRLGLKDVSKDEVIENIDEHVRLTENQLKLNKLAALYLLTSRGIIMLAQGQEFARSKVIPLNANTFDPHRGMIDHNSYEKDNETNYINYNHANINANLLDYYKGLIHFRNHYEAFRRAEYSQVTFLDTTDNPFFIGYLLEYNYDSFIVLCNANVKMSKEIQLPEGEWDVLVNSELAGIESIGRISSKIILDSSTGVILKKVYE